MEMHCYVYITLISCIRNKKVYQLKKKTEMSVWGLSVTMIIFGIDGRSYVCYVIWQMIIEKPKHRVYGCHSITF